MENGFKNTTFGERLINIAFHYGYDFENDSRAFTRFATDLKKSGYYVGSGNLENITGQVRKHAKLDFINNNISSNYLNAYCRFFNCSADYFLGYIDSFTHESTDISKITGLNEKSIRYLKHNKDISVLINQLLNHCTDQLHDLAQLLIDSINNIPGFDFDFELFKLTNNIRDTSSTLLKRANKGTELSLLAFESYYLENDFDIIIDELLLVVEYGSLNLSSDLRQDYDSSYNEFFSLVTAIDLFNKYPKEFIMSNLSNLDKQINPEHVKKLYDKNFLNQAFNNIKHLELNQVHDFDDLAYVDFEYLFMSRNKLLEIYRKQITYNALHKYDKYK